MRCWCGHGPWHRFGPMAGSGYGPGYGHWHGGYGPEFPRGPRRRRARAEELEDYLSDLEEQVAAARAELEELRKSNPPS